MNLQYGLFGLILLLLFFGCKNSKIERPQEIQKITPQLTKGYELYSWTQKSNRFYTLITGTNRLKSVEELTTPKDIVDSSNWFKVTVLTVDSLVHYFEKLPPNSEILWFGKSRNKEEQHFTYPPEEGTQYILERANSFNLRIYLTDR